MMSDSTAVRAIPIVWEEIMKVCGDEEVAAAVVDTVLEEIPQTIASLKDAVLAKDAAQIQFYSHRLKNSAKNVGAMDLSSYCYQLELAAKAQMTDGVQELYCRTEAGVDVLWAFLKQPDWISRAKQSF